MPRLQPPCTARRGKAASPRLVQQRRASERCAPRARSCVRFARAHRLRAALHSCRNDHVLTLLIPVDVIARQMRHTSCHDHPVFFCHACKQLACPLPPSQASDHRPRRSCWATAALAARRSSWRSCPTSSRASRRARSSSAAASAGATRRTASPAAASARAASRARRASSSASSCPRRS